MSMIPPDDRVGILSARELHELGRSRGSRLGLIVSLSFLAGAFACYAWFAVKLGEWRVVWFLERPGRFWVELLGWALLGLAVAVSFGKVARGRKEDGDGAG